MKRRACSLLLAACVAAVVSRSARADKPGSDTIPPVTVTPDSTVFEDRYSDLGGVLDTETGLVWGYDSWSISVTSLELDWLLATGANTVYLGILDESITHWSDATYGDPEIAVLYQDAYNVAVQYDGAWRLPTIAEAQDAVSKGLFTYGDGGLNVYYGAPHYSVPDMYGVSGWRYSADLGNHPIRGLPSDWVWIPEDGSGQIIGDSILNAVFVRTASPAELGQ